MWLLIVGIQHYPLDLLAAGTSLPMFSLASDSKKRRSFLALIFTAGDVRR
jgi:hypothetical protein